MGRITQHFNEHRPNGSRDARPLSSLESKWGTINVEISQFTVAYENVVDLNQSGTFVDDPLVKAKELYMAKHPKGKSFAFHAC